MIVLNLNVTNFSGFKSFYVYHMAIVQPICKHYLSISDNCSLRDRGKIMLAICSCMSYKGSTRRQLIPFLCGVGGKRTMGLGMEDF